MGPASCAGPFVIGGTGEEIGQHFLALPVSQDTHLVRIIAADALRMEALRILRERDLMNGWIGAGFVRDAVWDVLHGRPPSPPMGDVDVLWFDPQDASAERDRALELWFCEQKPTLRWSVKNQARMHLRNGDMPYCSVEDAMRFWPETATAIAVRLDVDGEIEVNAPFGLDDLFALRLRPGPAFLSEKRRAFEQRIESKRWLMRYPHLVMG